MLSPAFATDGPPAFELKFLISAETAAAVEVWAEAHLSRDTHGDPALKGSYEISTLYLDTPRFDVFHDAKELDGVKLRLRCYGNGSPVFLERKRRRADRVQKWRTPVESKDLRHLAQGSDTADWSGSGFQDEVEAREYRPVCLLTYLRAAFFHPSDVGHLRLTLDRAIRCAAASDWSASVVPEAGSCAISEDLVICELKFREAMPQSFKQLIAELGLTPGRFSKYRRACRALGLVSEREATDA